MRKGEKAKEGPTWKARFESVNKAKGESVRRGLDEASGRAGAQPLEGETRASLEQVRAAYICMYIHLVNPCVYVSNGHGSIQVGK